MEKETSRVETFSDSVFAIALTLLILNIQVPNLSDLTTNETLFFTIIKLWPSYIAFILSFSAVLIMWINHHGFFKYLKKIDTGFLFANGFLLLSVTFINYPTAVLARYINTPAINIASAFYCGSMLLVSTSYNLLWYSAAYKRRLMKDEISSTLIIKIRNAYLIGFFFYIFAFVISFFIPIIGLMMSILLWVFWIVIKFDNKKKPSLTKTDKRFT